MESKSYTDLLIWQRSRQLTSAVYQATQGFPQKEVFGLTSQIRRSAVSVPSNIAEGCGRQHAKDAISFFYVSRGSLYELENQLYLSFDQSFLSEETLHTLLHQITDCKKLLHGFINHYKSKLSA